MSIIDDLYWRYHLRKVKKRTRAFTIPSWKKLASLCDDFDSSDVSTMVLCDGCLYVTHDTFLVYQDDEILFQQPHGHLTVEEVKEALHNRGF